MNKFVVAGMVVAGVSAGFAFLNARVKKNESKVYVSTLVRAMEGTKEAMKDPEVQAAMHEHFQKAIVVGEDGLDSINRNMLNHVYFFHNDNPNVKAYIFADGHVGFFDLEEKAVSSIHAKECGTFESFKAMVLSEMARVKATNC